MSDLVRTEHRVGIASTGGAVMSRDGRYRYALERMWLTGVPPVLFVMLNPSTADAATDDATIRRCVGFAKREQRGGLIVANLYAWRATDPRDLARVADPIGPHNDQCIREASLHADLIVVAWGANVDRIPNAQARVESVLALLGERRLCCLGLTGAGHPLHPLRLRVDTPLERYEATS